MQSARVAADSILLLGIALPASEAPFGSIKDKDDEIDLDPAVFESNEILKRRLGFCFNVRQETQKLQDISNLS